MCIRDSITTDEGMTWNQIYAVLASAMGAPLCAAYVASKCLAVCGRAAGYECEGPLLGDKAANVRFDNTKSKRLVPDFAPRVSMAQGIRGAVEYLLCLLYTSQTVSICRRSCCG